MNYQTLYDYLSDRLHVDAETSQLSDIADLVRAMDLMEQEFYDDFVADDMIKVATKANERIIAEINDKLRKTALNGDIACSFYGNMPGVVLDMFERYGYLIIRSTSDNKTKWTFTPKNIKHEYQQL